MIIIKDTERYHISTLEHKKEGDERNVSRRPFEDHESRIIAFQEEITIPRY